MRGYLIAIGLGVMASAALAADTPARAPGPVIKTTTTSNGQPIALPQGSVEVTAVVVEVGAGASTPVHQHVFPRYGYVLQGQLEISYLDTGEKKVLNAGEFFIDPIGTWHQGRAIGPEPVRMLIIDQTPPGKSNMVVKDAPPPAP